MENKKISYVKTADLDWQGADGSAPSANDLIALNKCYHMITSYIEDEEWTLDQCFATQIGDNINIDIEYQAGKQKYSNRGIIREAGLVNYTM